MTSLQAYLQSSKTRKVLSKKSGEAGFSLIELVIVVAILAILAALGIPAFNNAQVRAREASAKTGLATAYKECEVSKLLGTASHTVLIDGGGITYGGEALNATCAANTTTVFTSAVTTGGATYRIDLSSGTKTHILNGTTTVVTGWN
jgi:type IV pilus assembly protein PilA